MKNTKAKALTLGALLVAVWGTTAGECSGPTANDTYRQGTEGVVVKRELVKAPINVKDYFLTTEDSRGFRDRFEVNKVQYNGCAKGEEYPHCAR